MDDMPGLEPSFGSRGYMAHPETLRIEPTKITDYLLNKDHPVGGSKARFFNKQGFSLEKWEDLQSALRTHAITNKISEIVKHEYGEKLIVECSIKSPNGKEHCIRVVWNDHLDGKPPKLITAHPLG